MDHSSLLIFLSLVAIGSYIQTVTGFALGLLVMGAVTVLGLAPVSVSAVVVSMLAFINSLLALRKGSHDINWKMVRAIVAGLLPAVFVGLLLLQYLSTHAVELLKPLLGIVIIGSGLFLIYKPHPKPTVSTTPGTFAIGLFGGVLGGLFSTSGPPIIFHLYRQPLSLPAVRATLLTIFILAAMVRLTYVGLRGEITLPILQLGLYSLPLVIIFTSVGRRFRPPLTDLAMRRMAFGLLVLLGILLLIPAASMNGVT